jgi:hypothetical protein
VMDEKEQFFVSESSAHARSLPLPECIRYLEGFISVIGARHPAAARLRSIYRGLVDSDQQLDLIQLGQMKLPLTPSRRKR